MWIVLRTFRASTKWTTQSANLIVSRAEGRGRVDVEDYKMFKRWEWLVEPRSYPSGRLDMEQIAAARAQVTEMDAQLVAQPAAKKPVGPPTWKPLGPSDAIGGTNMGRVTCRAIAPAHPK